MDIIGKLPIDVIREYILPYIYLSQSKNLCDDIKSFVTTKRYLINSYIYRYNFYHDGVDFLIMDICNYINDDKQSPFSYSNDCMMKYRRLFNLQYRTNRHIYKFVKRIIHTTQPDFSINTQLGILNPKEREKLVQYIQLRF